VITTRAGQLVLTSLRESSRTAIGELPQPVRVLREVFAVAVRRCFVGREPRQITAYVRDLLDRRGLRTGGTDAREVEAVIRSALGELELVAGIPDECRVAIMILVVGDLARTEANGSDAALFEALVEQAERRVARFDPPLNGRPWRRWNPR
jgi:hypothetical protein